MIQANSSSAIQVVYPRAGHTTYENSTFIMGQVLLDDLLGQHPDLHHSTIKFEIQNQQTRLSEHGYFSQQVALQPGQNTIQCRLICNTQTLAETDIVILMHPPLPVLPASSLTYHPESIQPDRPVAWLTGTPVTVSISTSLNTEALLEIPGLLNTPVPLTPLFPNATINPENSEDFIDNREIIFSEPHFTQPKIPKAGYVQGVFKIPKDFSAAAEQKQADLSDANTHIHWYEGWLHLSNSTGQKSLSWPHEFGVFSQPLQAMVTTEKAVFRVSPPNGDRLTPLPKQTRLIIDGFHGNPDQPESWARVRLGPTQTGWVCCKDIRFVSALNELSVRIQSVQYNPDSGNQTEYRFHLSLSDAIPIQIETTPDSLTCTLYHTVAEPAITNTKQTASQTGLSWEIIPCDANQTQLNISWQDKQFCGYDYGYDKTGLWIGLRFLPKAKQDTRILIDPGHGGEEYGAIGLSGIPEKAFNLTVAKQLLRILNAEGFQVSLTRTDDQTVSLEERFQKQLQINAHLLISLHHNALPDGRNPQNYQGVCGFYYHPFSKPLTEAIQTTLTRQSAENQIHLNNQGLYTDSLFITRIHQSLSVLIELGFFTHPDDYEKITHPDFPEQTAKAITNAIGSLYAH